MNNTSKVNHSERRSPIDQTAPRNEKKRKIKKKEKKNRKTDETTTAHTHTHTKKINVSGCRFAPKTKKNENK